jgi:hypothetical protein
MKHETISADDLTSIRLRAQTVIRRFYEEGNRLDEQSVEALLEAVLRFPVSLRGEDEDEDDLEEE